MPSSPWVVSDELWELVEPLLPRKERRSSYPGRKRLSDREVLCGVLFVLHTGRAWTHLPQELGLLRAAGEIEWSRAIAVDSSQIQAKGGSETGPSPVDRGRAGAKYHLLTDAHGTPLAWTLTGGNRNDVTQLLPLLGRVPAVAGLPGRPRCRPERVVADRGYDHPDYIPSVFDGQLGQDVMFPTRLTCNKPYNQPLVRP